MSINVQYGPISAALGMAKVGGAGAGYNIQAQRDLQAMGLQNQMQQTINANDANLISMAMQRDAQAAAQQRAAEAEHQQQLYHQQQTQQQAAELAARNRQLDLQGENTKSEISTREAQAKDLAAQRAQALQDKKSNDAWLKTLTPEQLNAAMSHGNIKTTPEITPYQQGMLDAKQAALDAAGGRDQTNGLRKDEAALLRQIGIIQKKLIPDPQDAELLKDLNSQLAEKRAQIANPVNAKGFDTSPVNTPAPAPAGSAAPDASTGGVPIPKTDMAAAVQATQAAGLDVMSPEGKAFAKKWWFENAAKLQGARTQPAASQPSRPATPPATPNVGGMYNDDNTPLQSMYF